MDTIEFQTSVQDGVIHIPEEYRQNLQNANKSKVTIQKAVSKKKISSTGIISRLIQNPIPVKNFKPLTREDAHERD